MTQTLTLDDLTAAVRDLLNVAGLPYNNAALRNYLDAVWGLVKLDPDPGYWARRYAVTMGLSAEG